MKRNKLLSLILSLSLVFSASFVNSKYVQAGTLTADQLYANAYSAVMTAVNTGKQKDINNARNAISALNGTGASWAIGEFSKQVDKVQQPILVDIVNSINEAKAEPCQANVNVAKATIEKDLPSEWKNAYSQAVDNIEQGIINDAVNAIDKAKSSGTIADINIAIAKITDIQSSTDANIVWYIDCAASPIVSLAIKNNIILPRILVIPSQQETDGKTGNIEGSLTWQYNKYIGTRADNGAKVILIPCNFIKKINDSLFASTLSVLQMASPQGKYGIYTTEANGYGYYKFNNIADGKYFQLVISNNTSNDFTVDIFTDSVLRIWFNQHDREGLETTLKLNKNFLDIIEIKDGQTTEKSYDFGYSYF